MATTYEPIATTTLSSAASSITFYSISSAYTDLRLVIVTRSTWTSANDNVIIRFNNDSSTNYSGTYLLGSGTTAYSQKDTAFSSAIIANGMPTNADTSGILGMATVDIFSYAGSTFKTVLGTGSGDTNGGGRVSRTVNLWRSTAAITSIQCSWDVGPNFIAGTTATLYGIKAA